MTAEAPHRIARHVHQPVLADMGAQLVGRAFAWAAQDNVDLKPNERLLLLFMALTAKDTDPNPRYFRRREESAIALGRVIPDAPSPDHPLAAFINAERDAAFQRVKVATQGLVRAGAIARSRRGREGQRAEYLLVFGTHSDPRLSTHSDPLRGFESNLSTGRVPYPQGTTEEPQGIRRGEISDPAVPYLTPVDTSREEHSDAA